MFVGPMRPFDAELDRLEGHHVTGEDHWRSRMWRRSYLVANNAITALEKRVKNLKKTQWDTPMVFFYPES